MFTYHTLSQPSMVDGWAAELNNGKRLLVKLLIKWEFQLICLINLIDVELKQEHNWFNVFQF